MGVAGARDDTMSDTFATRLDGPPVEQIVAADMVKRGLVVLPLLVGLAALTHGFDGAASTAYGAALVLVNFAVAAALLSWSARISLALLMGAALGGYLLRLCLLTAAILAVRNAGWVEMVPLGLTIIVTHLGLLFWETRYVSASLAFPALAPRPDDQSKGHQR